MEEATMREYTYTYHRLGDSQDYRMTTTLRISVMLPLLIDLGFEVTNVSIRRTDVRSAQL
jgi:hypothetical protein